MTLAPGAAPTSTWIEALGWIGQTCFFGRFAVQWVASEKAGRSVTPPVFWTLSVLGASLNLTYSYLGAKNLVFCSQYLITLAIFLRNVVLARSGARRLSRSATSTLALVLLVAVVALLRLDPEGVAKLKPDDPVIWLVIGFTGTLLWIARFVVQWFLAERTGETALTPVFFWISLPGTFLLLAYAIHLEKLVLIAGFAPNALVYARNLWLGAGRPAPRPPEAPAA